MVAKANPTLRDLAGEVQRATIAARAELDSTRRQLDELRAERETILNAPLHTNDLEAELTRHLTRQAAEAGQWVRDAITEMANKSGRMATIDPDQCANFSPIQKKWTAELLALLTDPAEASRRLIQAAGPLVVQAAGLPLDERRAAVADLDQKIAALEAHEAELVNSLVAAGVRVATTTPVEPDPQPGEVRTINGRRMQFGYAPGGGATPGWLPA